MKTIIFAQDTSYKNIDRFEQTFKSVYFQRCHRNEKGVRLVRESSYVAKLNRLVLIAQC